MNYEVSYDENDLRLLEKNIKRYGEELIYSLDKILKELSTLDNIYNTPSGKLFKEKITDFIVFERKYIMENYLPMKDIMGTIIREYNKNNIDINKALGDN